MKITFVGTLPPIKALSPYCYHLAEALSKKHEVEIFTPYSVDITKLEEFFGLNLEKVNIIRF